MNNKKNLTEIEKIKNKINELTNNDKSLQKHKQSKGGLSFGFRIGIEIVVALVVGVFIGIIVDNYFGTKPFGLIIFFILGSLAGFLNVYRVMRRIEKQNIK